MKPDKIYITEYNANVQTGYFSRNKDDVFTEEYICKDALLEWAKEKLENLKGLLDADPYKEVYVGKCEVLKDMMEKLNSM